MKKFLSMVLALVMVMSLVTVSAGAKDFTDNSEIQYEKAVAVVSAIGVVDGYEDGSFNPQGTLTRGAAAKIICNLILGPTTASALTADTAPYSDVSTDHTFAGYIAYCQQKGIISGYADGTFRPSATLTGYAFMKMLLGALGYDADIEGYTGNNWSINVAKQALSSDVDLADGNDDFVGQQAVTREEACLYAFNTLTATMVDYDSKTTVEVNGATVNVGNSKAYEVERTSGKDYTGVNENSDRYDSCGTQQFCEKYFDDLTADKTERDDFGRPATQWDWDGDEIGTYADDPDSVYVVADHSKSLETLMTDSDYLDYSAKDINDDAEVYFNGIAQDDYADSKSDTGLAGKGDIIEVFEDDDNDAAVIVVRSYTYAMIDDVDDDVSTSLKNKGASYEIDLVDIDDEDIGTYYDDHDDDDKILAGFSADEYTEGTVIAVAFGKQNNKTAIIDSYVVESITGTPTAARAVELYSYSYYGEAFEDKGVKQGTITIDGTKYTYAAQMTGLDEGADVDFDEEYVVYLTAEGYVLAVDGDAAASLKDVYYVVGAYYETSRGESVPYVQAISVDDGVESTLRLDNDHEKDTDALIDLIDDSKNDTYTEIHAFYTLKSDGSRYDAEKYSGSNRYDVVERAELTNDVTSSSTLLRLDGGTKGDEVDNNKATSADISRLYIDDTTFFIGAEDVGSNLDISTATGKMSADCTTEGLKVSAIYDDDDAVFVVYAATELSGAADKTDIVYLTDDATTRATKDTYLVDLYFMNDMSLEEDVEIDDDESDQGFYIYDEDSDGVYDLDRKSSNEIDVDTNGEIDDDGDGYAEFVVFTEVKNSSATNSTSGPIFNEAKKEAGDGYTKGDFIAVSFSGATVIDTRGNSDKKDDIYSNDITTTSRLASAIDKGWVVADVYVEDGDIIFVAVRACEDADSSSSSTDDEEEETTDLTEALNDALAEVADVTYEFEGDDLNGVSASIVRNAVKEAAEAAITDTKQTYTVTVTLSGYTAPAVDGAQDAQANITVTVSDGTDSVKSTITVDVYVYGMSSTPATQAVEEVPATVPENEEA